MVDEGPDQLVRAGIEPVQERSSRNRGAPLERPRSTRSIS